MPVLKRSGRFFDAQGVNSVLGMASVASHCAWELRVGVRVGGESSILGRGDNMNKTRWKQAGMETQLETGWGHVREVFCLMRWRVLLWLESVSCPREGRS